MNTSIIDIPNWATPIGHKLSSMLTELSWEKKAEILEGMTEPEFINYRVNIYLAQLEQALLSGVYSISGAEEIAEQESMTGFSI